jgi:hypothetical protein
MKIRAAEAEEKLGYNCVNPAAAPSGSKKDRGLAVFQPLPQEMTRNIQIGRFPVELTIPVEQRGQDIQIGNRRLANGQLIRALAGLMAAGAGMAFFRA